MSVQYLKATRRKSYQEKTVHPCPGERCVVECRISTSQGLHTFYGCGKNFDIATEDLWGKLEALYLGAEKLLSEVRVLKEYRNLPTPGETLTYIDNRGGGKGKSRDIKYEDLWGPPAFSSGDSSGQKYEFKVVPATGINTSSQSIQEEFNELGGEGWRLVHIQGHRAFFQRPAR